MMQIAYLGLFQKVFNWILERIFDPIFEWISNLLTTVLKWLFDEILKPILLPILKEAIEFLIDLYLDIYSVFIYTFFSGVLKLIDYMETAFDVFIGLRPVTYDPNPSVANDEITGSLVEVLLQQNTVSKIFWLLTMAGLTIAMVLTIVGVTKSTFDLDFENKRPVSKVLTAMMKTFIQFFSVPIFVLFMLKLSVAILQVSTDALTGGISSTLGRVVFIVSSLNAAKTKGFNAVDKPKFQLGTSSADTVRYPFYVLNANGTSTRDYGDIGTVQDYFDISNFDYLIGFLAAFFLLITLAICLVTFVQRIFEIILLYIVSPYFVSTMPLDDGEKFGKWREMFISKCFTGFGSAIGMRMYLLICPLILGGQISFGDNNSIEIDYVMKLFFLVGGAWAIMKAGPMITTMFNFSAGQSEAQTQAVVGGAIYAHTVGKAMSAGKGALASAFRGKAGEKASAKDKNTKNRDPEQKFVGGGVGAANSGQASGTKAGALAAAGPDAKTRDAMKGIAQDAAKIGAGRAAGPSDEARKTMQKAAKEAATVGAIKAAGGGGEGDIKTNVAMQKAAKDASTTAAAKSTMKDAAKMAAAVGAGMQKDMAEREEKLSSGPGVAMQAAAKDAAAVGAEWTEKRTAMRAVAKDAAAVGKDVLAGQEARANWAAVSKEAAAVGAGMQKDMAEREEKLSSGPGMAMQAAAKEAAAVGAGIQKDLVDGRSFAQSGPETSGFSEDLFDFEEISIGSAVGAQEDHGSGEAGRFADELQGFEELSIGPTAGAQTSSDSKTAAAGATDQKTVQPAKPVDPEKARLEKIAARSGSGFKIGRLLQNSYDANGNHKIRVLGIGINKDVDGRVTAVKLPGMKLKRDADGGMKLARLHIPAITKIDSNVKDGKINYTDVSILRKLNYHKSEDNTKNFQLGKGRLFNIATQDGEFKSMKLAYAKIETEGEDVALSVGSKIKVGAQGARGFSMGFGNAISINTNKDTGKLDHLHIGAIEYNRDGTITKKKAKKTENGGGEA